MRVRSRGYFCLLPSPMFLSRRQQQTRPRRHRRTGFFGRFRFEHADDFFGRRPIHRVRTLPRSLLLKCGVHSTLSSTEQRMILLRRLLGDHVNSRAGDFPLLQRRAQRLLVDDAAARGVDQEG